MLNPLASGMVIGTTVCACACACAVHTAVAAGGGAAAAAAIAEAAEICASIAGPVLWMLIHSLSTVVLVSAGTAAQAAAA
jgi:hypothetical protein